MTVTKFDSLQGIPTNLLKHSIEVFSTEQGFKRWLNTINFFFDKKAPIEFINTAEGIKYIDDRLTGIAYGDNA
ncbi:MbcA/ParS/Xre antitoxin family protein [Mucilaginibacter sp.]|uniref:MbcA/ParS/Xre antitoxin family protein n=1 Tax=Mucilaginibacter sp. TaxID=1882438 RepID=UPI0025EAD240|nr:MbcA/ParS/Xre antitoxin family protein [Mucilaginibacter sp.]